MCEEIRRKGAAEIELGILLDARNMQRSHNVRKNCVPEKKKEARHSGDSRVQHSLGCEEYVAQ